MKQDDLGQYTVMIEEHHDKEYGLGKCIRESCKKNGVLHHPHSPAVILREIETGQVIIEAWYNQGKLHRDNPNEPAVIETTYRGDKISCLKRSWHQYGQLHRVDAPAVLELWLDDGIVALEEWAINGVRHREDGPAYISRDINENGEAYIITESWHKVGMLHRINGPAYVTRDHGPSPYYTEEE
ncbi:MAG: hypothetical protein ACKO96_27275, partial [Flammeovirgaceae bacterium]